MNYSMIVSNHLSGQESEVSLRNGMMIPVKPGDQIALFTPDGYPAEVGLERNGNSLTLFFEDASQVRLANFYENINPSAPVRLSVAASSEIEGVADAFLAPDEGQNVSWMCYSNYELDQVEEIVPFEPQALVEEAPAPLEVVTSQGSIFTVVEEPRPFKLVPILPDDDEGHVVAFPAAGGELEDGIAHAA